MFFLRLGKVRQGMTERCRKLGPVAEFAAVNRRAKDALVAA
jgi:hypothetical protein